MGILFGLFFLYFGYPSFHRYLAQNTLSTERKMKFKSNEPPAITIQTWITGSDIPWKGKHEEISYTDIFKNFCNKSEVMNDTLSCINDKTFHVTEVVEQAQCRGDDLHDPGFWDEDLSYVSYGKLLTLHESYKIGTNWFDSLRITLNKTYMDYKAVRYILFNFYIFIFNGIQCLPCEM